MKCIFDCNRKQLTGIMRIGFNMDTSAVQTFEGLVQNRDEPLLFLQRWEGDEKLFVRLEI